MDTKLIIGKVIDGKTIISAKFDESTQFTTVYFDDNTFRVFTPDEASEVFTDENTFVHVVTQDDLAANPELGGVVAPGDLISAPMGAKLTPEEIAKIAEEQPELQKFAPQFQGETQTAQAILSGEEINNEATLTSGGSTTINLQTDVTTQTQND